MASFLLLAVDDDPDQAIFLNRAFRKAGLPDTLRIVQTGAEALDYAAGRGAYADRSRHPRPTHVFVDLRMPALDGLELLERIRRDVADVRSAVLTSSTQPSEVARAYEAGADLFLLKPLSLEGLSRMVAGLRPWFEEGRRPDLPPDLLLAP
jgi:CheY-like chemotaxis protein